MLSLLSNLFGSRRAAVKSTRIAPRTDRFFRPGLEGLEERTVMSHTALAPPALGPALVAPAQVTSPLTITGINVTNLAVTGANQLLATLTVVGQVAGQNFTLPGVQVPITLNLQDPQGACPILHLELEIPDLNVLGLHVQLDDCNNGPVTVDITAIPGGGVLGDLLCGLSGLLGGQGGLLNLTGAPLTQLTDVVTGALDGVLGDLLDNGTPGMGAMQAGRCDLVNLELGEIHLNVLGLQVDTSEICLDVFAQRGGGILGDLLCGINNLLNRNNPGNAVNALAHNVLRAIDRLNL